MSRILLDSELNPELAECAETIESSGNQLMTVIDDILDFSKIESGNLKLERRLLDLSFVMESAVNLISSQATSKNLNLIYEIDRKCPVEIMGDVTRIRQILLNLMSNAVKFTKEGTIHVSVVVEPLPETKPVRLLFAVKDTGVGIPFDRFDKLFTSFSQVDESTTREYGGTGLGLAISKRLSEMMGGSMWVKSTPNVGSTFYFNISSRRARHQPQSEPRSRGSESMETPITKRLPLKGGLASGTPRRKAGGSATGTPNSAGGYSSPSLAAVAAASSSTARKLAKVKVLVVDDNPVNLKVVCKMLARLGVEPDMANNGLEAVDKGPVQGSDKKRIVPYDLIFMDVWMPKMNGLDASTFIRDHLSGGTVNQPYIIAMTACVMPGDREKCIAAGMNDYISKPLRKEELEQCLRVFTNQHLKQAAE
ncbi:histidine kinase-like ATPase [Gamsiella multidivaricata]|uniref:histidine kinase-like ATPase n=1 Tax=Gamsiella multidivaricata TaxID=101098 RepID=UPI0022211271|nr:histidine kinase-like ATPase [Gamsiella multidivaricata]KAI7827487.1 histidine kinase-like ATPase [Gamsiella multidivaricata]